VAIRDGKIFLNLLDDLSFTKTVLKYAPGLEDNPVFLNKIYGMQIEDSIYIRAGRGNYDYSAIVHEGTHALDFLDGFTGWKYLFEKRAYFYEHTFELQKGLVPSLS
jgi:hypothetical protein